MKLRLTSLLLLIGLSAFANADVTSVFSGPYRIGRLDNLQNMMELRDFTLTYTYTTKAGEVRSQIVNVEVDLSDLTSSEEARVMNWLAEQKRNHALVTVYFTPDSIYRTDGCLGPEFVYKTEDEDGNAVDSCFAISPTGLIAD